VLRDSATQLLQAGGPPAGLLTDVGYFEDALELRSGDRCLFVTDGVTEALDEGTARPIAVVASAASGRFSSVRAMCDAIMNRSMLGEGPSGVEAWSDDRTVVAIAVSNA
jgi:serine phosphatase RsbU (regulator of sigma subunit)